MASKRKQLEKMLAETKDNVVRMQLTQMLNEELQRQNGVMRRVADVIDSLLREMIGLLGKRSPKNKKQVRTKNNKTTEKVSAQKSTKKRVAKKNQKPTQESQQKEQEQDKVLKQPDDLAEIIAIWPKLPEHVKAAIADIVRIS